MSGKRRQAEEGLNPGLGPPYGYTIVDKQFVIVDREAIIVRRMYENCLAGQSDGQIWYVTPAFAPGTVDHDTSLPSSES